MRAIVEFLVAVAVIAAYPLFAFYPFHFVLPVHVENGAVRAADGSLVFTREGIFETTTAPKWVKPAIAHGRFSIILDVVPARQAQHAEACILAVAKDRFRSNLIVWQMGNDLLIWLRTNGPGDDERREIYIPNVFASGRQTQVDLDVFPAGGRTRLEVHIDGLKRSTQDYPSDIFSGWASRDRLTLGNEPTGNRPWFGTIQHATARSGQIVVDYTAAGELERVARYWKVVNDPDLALFRGHQEWRDLSINLFGFMPLGMLIAIVLWRRGDRISWRPVLVSMATSMTLETVQFVIPGRSPSLADLICNTLGGLLGAALVAVFVRRWSWLLRRPKGGDMFERDLHRTPRDGAA